jgi:hypothetical protein
VQLVRNWLKPGNFANLSPKGFGLLGDGFEDYCAAGLFVLTASNAPPDAEHLERLLGGQIVSIRCDTGFQWREFC